MTPFQIPLDDGAVLVGETIGQGAPVLLISGLGGTSAFWKGVSFDHDKVQLIRFDQRGIGRSSRGETPLSIERLAADCIDVLSHLNVGAVHCVGHSTGGCIAQSLALTYPERIASLVLSGTWAGPNEYMQTLFEYRSRLLRNDAALYEQQGLYLSYPPDYLWNQPPSFFAGNASVWSEQRKQIVQERIAALLRFDARPDLGALRIPTLVLSAADDAVVPAPLQLELQQRIAQAEFQQWRTGGHFFL